MDHQKPTIGRIVLYYQGDHEAFDACMPHLADPKRPWEERVALIEKLGPEIRGANGHREHPAIITAVWGDTCVNLTVFFDAATPQMRSSASLLPDAAFADGVRCVNSGWRWPARA